MAIEFEEYFEGGTNTTALSTSNTGFSQIEGTGASTFSSTYAAEGNLSGKFVSTGAGGNYANGLRNFASNAGVCFLRFALYIEALPPVITYFSFASVASGTDPSVRINTDGTVTIRNNNIAVGTTTNSVPVDQWFLIEWKFDTPGVTQTLRLYNAVTDLSPVETINGQHNQGVLDGYKIGIPVTTAATIWVDAVASSFDDWVGPLQTPSATPTVAWLVG